MKAFDKIRETVMDPTFSRGAQTATVVGATLCMTGLFIYCVGYRNGATQALSAIDRGFKAADPEMYEKLLEKATYLVKTGAIK